ncbi:hypothetical protein FQZ97_1195980 [compost metagenome]
MIGAIDHPIAFQQPGVAARLRITMYTAQKIQAVLYLHRVIILQMCTGHRVIEDKASAAHQMACAPVVDIAAVPEKLIETAARPVDTAGMVELHRIPDVVEQKFC